MDGIASDKVNIHVGEGGGSRGYDGGAGLAAVIAALGNRNQGTDNASLIAALGNRNEKDYGPLFAMMANRRDDNDSHNMWPLMLLLLLGRRGFGGDDCDGGRRDGGVSPAQAALLQTLMEGQSALRAEGPENTLRAQGEIQQAIAALALGTQQGFANTGDKIQAGLLAELAAIAGTKDAVQNGFTLTGRDLAVVNQNVSAQGCQTREVVASEGQKTRDLINELNTGNLQRELTVAQNSLTEERGARRVREVEVNVSQVVTQAQVQQQQQAQLQAQFGHLFSVLHSLGNQVLRSRQDQDIVNLGTMTASGTQAAANTQVR